MPLVHVIIPAENYLDILIDILFEFLSDVYFPN
jgi:hypothetical protein